MQTKEGDTIKSCLDGMDYTIKKIVHRMAVLESESGNKQILTEIDNLKIRSLYQKASRNDIRRPDFQEELIKTL